MDCLKILEERYIIERVKMLVKVEATDEKKLTNFLSRFDFIGETFNPEK